MGTPQPHAGVRRKGGWVSWRTVPTFVAGVLATLAVAVLLLCRWPTSQVPTASCAVIEESAVQPLFG